MSLNLFHEIDRTNRAYCASLGLDCDTYDRPLSVAEVYGVPLSPEEVEVAQMMQNGTSRRAAELFVALNQMPAAPVRVRPSSVHRCIVEYARPAKPKAESEHLTDASIQTFYDACRRRTVAPFFVGD